MTTLNNCKHVSKYIIITEDSDSYDELFKHPSHDKHIKKQNNTKNETFLVPTSSQIRYLKKIRRQLKENYNNSQDNKYRKKIYKQINQINQEIKNLKCLI